MIHGSLLHQQVNGYTIKAYCGAVTGGMACGNVATLDLAQLIERFGPDFIIPHEYGRFIGSLRCAKCGSKEISLIIQPPDRSIAGR